MPEPLRAPVRTLLRILDGDEETGSGEEGKGTIWNSDPSGGDGENPDKDAAFGDEGGSQTAGPEPLPGDLSGYLVVDCLDVGQADCTLIRQGSHAMLFDCGAETPVTIRRFLMQEGITSLEAVWLSHADADHIGALASVAQQFPVSRICVSPFMESKDTYAYEQFRETVNWYRIPVQEVRPGDLLNFGDACSYVLGPVREDTEIPNNNSLVIRVVYGDTAVLLCGDAQAEEEADILAGGMQLTADVLHAGHHGSNTSSRRAFLQAASPSFAVISCGAGNDYGHPGTYALQRLQECGAKILRTDLDGNVRFLSDGNSFRASTEK